MKNPKKLTIVTVVKNDAVGLRKTILSLRDQLGPVVEYLIIDGASEDKTQEVLREFSGCIDKIVSEPDSGIYDAMNKGLSHSTGDWVYFLNAGDTIEPFVLNSILVRLEALSQGTILYGDFNLHSLCGGRCLRVSATHTRLLETMSLSHQAVFISRPMYLEAGGFSLAYKWASDFELMLRLLLLGARFERCDQVLANFYQGGASDKFCIQSRWEKILILLRHRSPRAMWGVSLAIREIITCLILFTYAKLLPEGFRKATER